MSNNQMKREDEKAEAEQEQKDGAKEDTKSKNKSDDEDGKVDESEMKVAAKTKIDRQSDGFSGKIADVTCEDAAKCFGAEEMSTTHPGKTSVDDSGRAIKKKVVEDDDSAKKLAYAPEQLAPGPAPRRGGEKCFGAEEMSTTHPGKTSVDDSGRAIKKKVVEDDESAKKLAYAPEQLAPGPAPRRGGEKEKGSDLLDNEESAKKLAYAPDQLAPAPRRKGDKSRLALFPPSLFVHKDEEDEEEKREETVIHDVTRPGANRVRGINWNGDEDEDEGSYTQFATENITGKENSATTDDYLVEAHVVSDPVIVEAKLDTFFRRNQWWVVGGGLAFLIMIITTIVLLSVDLSGPDAPTLSPTTIKDGIEDKVARLLVAEIPESEAALSNKDLPQYNALQWIVDKLYSDTDHWYSDERILQQYSLATLYLSTSSSDSSWNNDTNWMQTKDECNWYGVFCDVAKNIVGLNLFGNNLSGSIPADIRLLSALVSLNFNRNSLSGSLPLEIFELSMLATLELSQNHLDGGIPSTISKATSLSLLNLADNQLSSTIPVEIGKSSALKTIKLAHNKMIGSIPSEIGYLNELEEVELQDNSFSHKLPTEMGKLVKVTKLLLQENDLLGPLPSEIGLMRSLRVWDMSNNHVFDKMPRALFVGNSLKNLESLDLSHNLLTGDHSVDDFGSSWKKLTSLRLGNNFFRGHSDNYRSLPKQIIKRLPNLAELDISSNYFSGPVPNGLFDMKQLVLLNLGKSGMELKQEISEIIPKLSSMEQLDLSGCNMIAGSIPTEIGSLNNLNSLNLASNAWTGLLPTEITDLENLKSLYLGNNRLSGPIPSKLGNLANLESLDLYGNKLTGQIPSELGNLENLQDLNLSYNQLIGSIPTELGNLVNLAIIDLGGELTGQIPSELGNLVNLESLDLLGNKLTGQIPSELGNLENLQDLNLSYNQLSGSIPTELGNLSNLAILDPENNRLSGAIPSELGNLANLEYLALRYNNLGAQIPSELGNLGKIKFLYLYLNRLSGSIPSDLGNLVYMEELWIGYNRLSGPIPSELGNLANLGYLALRYNQLSGPIPSELGNLANLEYLYLGYDQGSFSICNQLTGSIPSELGNLANLESLALNGNQLTGSIPSELGNLVYMEELWLDANQLTGLIPSELGNLVYIEEILLAENNLSGSIPFSFCEMIQNSLIKVDCDRVICHCCVDCTQYSQPSASTFPSISPTTSVSPTASPTSRPSALPSSSKTPSLSLSPSAIPSKSQIPTQEPVIVTIELTLDYYPVETGWKITDVNNDVIYETTFDTYDWTQRYETVYKSVLLANGSSYTFHLLDSFGDGQNGRVVIYLGDVPSPNTIVGYYVDSSLTFFFYEIPFLASEEGIIENTFPTASPSISPSPSLSTSKSEIVTIELKFDNYPYQTGWKITDVNNDVIYETTFDTYDWTQRYETVYKSVLLANGSSYTFHLLDSFGDGQNGRVVIYLGDVPSPNTIVGYYVDSSLTFFSYEIPFLASEEGIVENIFPTTSPSIS